MEGGSSSEYTADEEASVHGLTQASKVVFSASLEEPLTWANTTLVRDEAVYGLVARVTGIDRDTSRFLTVTELRRKTQRRATPRAPIDELVLISHNGDIDAELIDISADGLSFLRDRALPIAATITAVINFQGSVIPAF